MNFSPDKACAEELDSQDLLAEYRERFHIPKRETGESCIYFSGNSLGLAPKTASAYVQQELDDWARLGVEGHFKARHPWLPYHEFLAEQTARLVGAKPIEVVVMNTLTVNLHLMMVSFYRPTPERFKVLMEARAFPSDRYAVQTQIKFHGYDPERGLITVAPRPGETAIRTEDIQTLLEREGSSIALVLLGGVNYYTGQAFALPEITHIAHQQGCTVGFDLAHAVGNLPLSLHDWDVDFAVWCSYKYLNAGPGSLAGCFVHERFADRADLPRFAGWWGQNKRTRFQMGPDFDAIPGAEGWQISNPPIFSLAALRASIEIFDEVGMQKLRDKSLLLTAYLEYLIAERLSETVSIATPTEPSQRGCQLSLKIQGGDKAICDRLNQRGIICDWREPDVLRVAPVPLYNRYTEVFDFVRVLQEEYTKEG